VSNASKLKISILATALSAVFINPALATPVIWVGASSFWDISSNWSPFLPGAGDDVTIDALGIQTITYRSGTDTINSLNMPAIIGTDTLAVTGGSLTISNAFTNNANTNISGGTFTLNGSSSVTGVQLTGGLTYLTGAGNVQVASGGVFTWVGGTQEGTGSTTIANGGTMDVTGETYLTQRSLNNSGTVVVTTTGDLQNSGTINNAAGATFNFQGTGTFSGLSNGSFNNAGLVTKTDTGTSTIWGAFNNTGGTVDVQSGTLQLPSNFTNTGTLNGLGAYTVSGTLTNNGHVAPGSIGTAPGALTVNGNYAQTALGSFDVGLQDLTHFGSLTVNGKASLGGALSVDCVGSCSFTAGTDLLVLQSTGTLSGTFSNLVTSGFAAGAFNVSYVGNDVYLDITQNTVAAVPEPESYAMMLAGLTMVGAVARRRKAA
jgi:PEP-CTERM motif-containing protein